MLGATDCMDGCGLGGDGKNPLEYSDTSSSSSSTTRKIITNPFPFLKRSPPKGSKNPPPSFHMQCFVAWPVKRGPIAYCRNKTIAQFRQTRPARETGRRSGLASLEDNPTATTLLRFCDRGQRGRGRERKRLYTHCIPLGTSNPCIYCTYVVAAVYRRNCGGL